LAPIPAQSDCITSPSCGHDERAAAARDVEVILQQDRATTRWVRDSIERDERREDRRRLERIEHDVRKIKQQTKR
jgi:hypothetical protein